MPSEDVFGRYSLKQHPVGTTRQRISLTVSENPQKSRSKPPAAQDPRSRSSGFQSLTVKMLGETAWIPFIVRRGWGHLGSTR